MSIQTLSDQIISKANQRKEEVGIRTQEVLNSLKKDFTENFEKFKLSITDGLERDFSFLKKDFKAKELSMFNQEVLEAKKDALDCVKNEVFEIFLSFSESQRKSFYKGLYEKASKLIPNGRILCSNSDVKIFESFFDGEVVVDDRISFGGILVSEDETQRVVFTIEKIVEDYFKENSTDFLGDL